MDDRGPAGRRATRPRCRGSPRIVVVGPCAAGKTTLVAALRGLGHDARAAGQEHSDIPTLWRRSEPDIVIALEVDIAAVRARRGDDWPEWLHDLQVSRLRHATAAADLTLDTTRLDAPAVVARVLAFLAARRAS